MTMATREPSLIPAEIRSTTELDRLKESLQALEKERIAHERSEDWVYPFLIISFFLLLLAGFVGFGGWVLKMMDFITAAQAESKLNIFAPIGMIGLLILGAFFFRWLFLMPNYDLMRSNLKYRIELEEQREQRRKSAITLPGPNSERVSIIR